MDIIQDMICNHDDCNAILTLDDEIDLEDVEDSYLECEWFDIE